MKAEIKRLHFVACCVAALSFPVEALAVGHGAEIDFSGLNDELVEHYVLPRYVAFAEAATALEDSLAQSCGDGRIDEGESVEAYHEAMDAWMAVQHLRFGPSELFLRAERLEFWPDKRGTVRRHLAQLLSDRNAEGLDPQFFANGSVAVQGFPALERLLFDSDEVVWATPYGCDLVKAIGRNIRTIAVGLSGDWRDGPQAYAAVIRGAADGNETYMDAKEGTLELAKAMRGALLLVADYKLGRPLGESAQAARTTRAESWRSGRSLRNVRINLKAAQAMYDGGQTGGGFSALVRSRPSGGELDGVVLTALQQLVTEAEALPDSMEDALASDSGWEKLNALRSETQQLLELLGAPLSEVLGLPVGFNSYDGD
jgi:predicted lipoprotein